MSVAGGWRHAASRGALACALGVAWSGSAQAQAVPLGAALAAQAAVAGAAVAGAAAAPAETSAEGTGVPAAALAEAGGAPLLVIAAAAPPAIAYQIAGDAPAPAALPPRAGHTKGDPLEKFNRFMYRTNATFDRIFFRPLAIAYRTVVPKFLRLAFRNILLNISEPLVAANDLLQLRPGRALRTLGRLTINTTLGLGGAIDVAKGEGLPHRNNGFGNTLARYGVGPGPYLFLPFFGPGTLRDTLGDQAEGLVYPLAVGSPFDRLEYQIPAALVVGLQQRIDYEAQIAMITRTAADPYATIRSLYLQSRKVEVDDVRGVKHGSPLEDPLTDPGDPGDDPAGSATPAEGSPPAAEAPPAEPPAAAPAPAPAPNANITPPEQLPVQPR